MPTPTEAINHLVEQAEQLHLRLNMHREDIDELIEETVSAKRVRQLQGEIIAELHRHFKELESRIKKLEKPLEKEE